MRRFIPTCFALLWTASALLLGGCGDSSRISTYRVTGTVTLDGDPLPDVQVVFAPQFEVPNEIGRPRGTTGPDGTYTLTSYQEGDGAPSGDYKVSIIWQGSKPEAAESSFLTKPDQSGPPETDPTAGRFVNPDNSGLEYTVEEKSNQINIALTSTGS